MLLSVFDIVTEERRVFRSVESLVRWMIVQFEEYEQFLRIDLERSWDVLMQRFVERLEALEK